MSQLSQDTARSIIAGLSANVQPRAQAEDPEAPPWLLTGQQAALIANTHRVRAGAVQAIAKQVHALRKAEAQPDEILKHLPRPNLPAGYPYLSRIIGTDLWDADQIAQAFFACAAPPQLVPLTRKQIDRIFDAHQEAPTMEFRYLVTAEIEFAHGIGDKS